MGCVALGNSFTCSTDVVGLRSPSFRGWTLPTLHLCLLLLSKELIELGVEDKMRGKDRWPLPSCSFPSSEANGHE